MKNNRKTLALTLLLATSHAYVSTASYQISSTHRELSQLANDLKKSSSLQDTLETLNYLALYLEDCVLLTDEESNTLLMLSAQQGFNQLAKLLLHLGADQNAHDQMGQTALTWATFRNNVTLTKILIEYQANVNLPGRHNWTALHWAVYNNNVELVTLLLEYKADITIKNSEGLTPCDCARMYASKEVVSLLEEAAQALGIQDTSPSESTSSATTDSTPAITDPAPITDQSLEGAPVVQTPADNATSTEQALELPLLELPAVLPAPADGQVLTEQAQETAFVSNTEQSTPESDNTPEGEIKPLEESITTDQASTEQTPDGSSAHDVEQSTLGSEEATSGDQPAPEATTNQTLGEQTPGSDIVEGEGSLDIILENQGDLTGDEPIVPVDETIVPIENPTLDALLQDPLVLEYQSQG